MVVQGTGEPKKPKYGGTGDRSKPKYGGTGDRSKNQGQLFQWLATLFAA
jgi:hypothetical protein